MTKRSSFRAKRGITIISAYVPHSGIFDPFFFQIFKYYSDLDFLSLEMSGVSKKLKRNDKKEVVFVQNVALPSFLLMYPTVALLTLFPFRFLNITLIWTFHPFECQGSQKS